MLAVLIVQNMVFCEGRPLGVCPLIFPAAAVAVGMFEGVTWGTVFSLILGLFADMGFVENTVMFTIALPVLSFAAGFVAQFIVNRRFFAYMVTAVLASLAAALLQMLKVTAAEGISTVMLTTVLLQTLWSVPPAILIYFPPARWID